MCSVTLYGRVVQDEYTVACRRVHGLRRKDGTVQVRLTNVSTCTAFHEMKFISYSIFISLAVLQGDVTMEDKWLVAKNFGPLLHQHSGHVRGCARAGLLAMDGCSSISQWSHCRLCQVTQNRCNGGTAILCVAIRFKCSAIITF